MRTRGGPTEDGHANRHGGANGIGLRAGLRFVSGGWRHAGDEQKPKSLATTPPLASCLRGRVAQRATQSGSAKDPATLSSSAAP